MKQIFMQRGRGIKLLEVPAPTCRDDGALIAFHYSLISTGTDLDDMNTGVAKKIKERPDLIHKVYNSVKKEGIAKTANMVRNKIDQLIPLGYSASGVIVEVGKNVHDLSVGDFVACAGAGFANHAEYGYVPRNLIVKIPPKVSSKEASFVALGAIALQGVRRTSLQIGEYGFVVGLGLVGQLTVQLLKSSGARVIGTDLISRKVEIANSLGLDIGIVPGTNDFEKIVSQHTKGRGVDAILLCASSENKDLINHYLPLCRDRGRIVVVGDVPIQIERDIFYFKEMDLKISRSYGPGRYDKTYEERSIDYPYGYIRWTENRNMEEFVNLVADKKINLEKLVTKVFSVEESESAYKELSERGDHHIAVLLKYPQDRQQKPADEKILMRHSSIDADKIRMSIVGTGDIIRSVHLQNIKNCHDVQIRGIMSVSGKSDPNLADKYGAHYITNSYDEILKDKETDCVVIASRHNLHAEMVIKAIQHGKPIFVEKPLAITREECDAIREAITVNPVKLMVGFNRRYSPLITTAKQQLKENTGVSQVLVRINTMGLFQGHWTNSLREGGGMLIGEGCHFFDLICFLLEDQPKIVSASIMQGDDRIFAPYSNFSVTIEFEKGSIGTLVYTTLGSSLLKKERIEIFSDGIAVVIDDFQELLVFGKRKYRKKFRKIEKGLLEEMAAFIDYFKNINQSVPSVNEGIRATLIGLSAIESMRTKSKILL